MGMDQPFDLLIPVIHSGIFSIFLCTRSVSKIRVKGKSRCSSREILYSFRFFKKVTVYYGVSRPFEEKCITNFGGEIAFFFYNASTVFGF